MRDAVHTHTPPHPGHARTAAPHHRNVYLSQGTLVHPHHHESRHAHILQSGLVSTSLFFPDGRPVTVRLYAAGDLLELDQLLGCGPREAQSRVLVEGVATRIPFDTLRTFLNEDHQLRETLFQSLGTRLWVQEQLAACDRVHGLEQRLARQVLILSIMLQSTTIPLTQEQLCQQLGVRRTSVVGILGSFRDRGLLHIGRGSIRLCSPEGLEQLACSCYAVLRAIHAAPSPIARLSRMVA